MTESNRALRATHRAVAAYRHLQNILEMAKGARGVYLDALRTATEAGCSEKDLARLLGITTQAVKLQVRHARRRATGPGRSEPPG